MIIKKHQTNKIDFNGLEIFDYTEKYDELSSFATIKVVPGARHQLSWSKKSDKYYYLMSGEIEFEINNKITIMNQGDLCIIKKGAKFRYQNKSSNEATLILVHTPNFDLKEEVFE